VAKAGDEDGTGSCFVGAGVSNSGRGLIAAIVLCSAVDLQCKNVEWE